MKTFTSKTQQALDKMNEQINDLKRQIDVVADGLDDALLEQLYEKLDFACWKRNRLLQSYGKFNQQAGAHP